MQQQIQTKINDLEIAGFTTIMTDDNFVIMKHRIADKFISVECDQVKNVALVKTHNFPISSVFLEEIQNECDFFGELDHSNHLKDDNIYATFAWFNFI